MSHARLLNSDCSGSMPLSTSIVRLTLPQRRSAKGVGGNGPLPSRCLKGVGGHSKRSLLATARAVCKFIHRAISSLRKVVGEGVKVSSSLCFNGAWEPLRAAEELSLWPEDRWAGCGVSI